LVRPGQAAERIDHYSILRTIEDMYQLPPIGQSVTTAPITNIWTTAK
jgi:phosphatidylinositol-3-phosphatase